jgi:hypothetical protein
MSNETEDSGRSSPEVSEKAARRRYSAEYKMRILDEVDRCNQLGQLANCCDARGFIHRSSRVGERNDPSGCSRSIVAGSQCLIRLNVMNLSV